MKTLINIIIFLSIGLLSHAQKTIENNTDYPLTHQIGITAGNFGSSGITYRYNVDDYAVQFIALPIWFDGEFYYSSGIGLMKRMTKDRAVNCSVLAEVGTNNLLSGDEASTNVSLGAVFDARIFEIFSIEMKTGLGYYRTTNWEGNAISRINPNIGFSLYYNL